MDSEGLRIEIIVRVEETDLNLSNLSKRAKKHLLGRGVKKAFAEIEIIGKARMRSLNKKFMKKDYPTDVLSFPLEKIPGEDAQNIGTIFVCNDIIKKQSSERGISYNEELVFLVCHGLDHLIGIHHS
ncbi:MAG: Endoribonuclease YbeY [candidate division WS2 bacterium ADurb.Bin280]|uniref:Endoribonuclease YbeY n=1 Tax=candidate division WS2 bacterium ADurb.Bin280 TaxID=1852829 RepID=A0A1V5SFZ0_9BACT|nr:MAG: Endoribonuclease YbeY [candidate division WS2 bacterium ADurb.Bin280]